MFLQGDGVLRIYGGAIRNNTAVRDLGRPAYELSPAANGGGIYVEKGQVFLLGGGISGNRAESCGGGIGRVGYKRSRHGVFQTRYFGPELQRRKLRPKNACLPTRDFARR